jgi:outer membrane immunogenic protein
MKKILLSSVALLGFSVAAQAADLPRRTMAPAPYVAAVPVFTWTGFYFGVNAGYAWSSVDVEDRIDLDRDRVFVGSNPGVIRFQGNGGDAEGFAGGAQIGWNYQFTPGAGWVVGLEADIQGIDLDRDTSDPNFTFERDGGVAILDVTRGDFIPVRRSAASLDYFGTVRGRLGYAWDRFLVYGTGGFAYGGGDRNGGCPREVRGNFTGNFCGDGDETRTGYAVGGGFEWALPVSAVNFFGSTAVTFGIEGLYVNLGDDGGDTDIVGFNARTGNVIRVDGRNFETETEFGVVRAKLNWKF